MVEGVVAGLRMTSKAAIFVFQQVTDSITQADSLPSLFIEIATSVQE